VRSARAAQTRLIIPFTILVVLGEILTWLLLRSQGNDLGGDQAHYLIAAQALSHLSVHPLPYYQRDFLTHFIYNWPAGASLTNHAIVQTYPGPHGSVFAHGIGLPLLLSPFIAIGSIPLGLVGMFTITALGLVSILVRGSLLADLSRRGEAVFALALAAPALWLASTQVYPDFMSGVLLGAALVEIGWIERRRYASVVNAVIIGGALAVEPWLQIKNLAPTLCCLVALALLSRRLPTQRRLLVTMAAVIAASFVLLAVYNQYFFSNLVGLPQPRPTFDLTSFTRVVALLFDRHQGLVVQVPTVLLGLVGLQILRRTLPLTAAAAALGALLVIVINGTYTSGVPFGGTDLAGRFQWTVLPVLLAWVPFCLAALDRSRRRIVVLGTGIVVLWLAQGIPILLGDHVYINAMIAPFAPWDPTLYPGWWPFIGQDLPTLLTPALHLAATWTHLAVEGLVLVAAGYILLRLTKAAAVPLRALLTLPAVLVVVAALVLVAGPTRTQPTGPLTWSGAAVGAPWSGTSQPVTTPLVELATVGPGTYRLSFAYGAAPGSGPATATLMATTQQHTVVAGWFSPGHPTDAARLVVTAPPIADDIGVATHQPLSGHAAHRHATLVLTVQHQSVLSFFVTVSAHSTIASGTLTLEKR
jgi:hypothetical protein